MKHYIFIHLYNDYSGSPRVLKELVSTLQEKSKNSNFHLIASNSNGILNKINWSSECRFKYKPKANKVLKLFDYLVSQIKIFSYTFLLITKLKKRNDDDITVIINTMLPFGASIAVYILKHKKVFHYIHETYIKPNILKLFLKKIISLTSGEIIFVSKYLMFESEFKNKKQHVIYNPISPELVSIDIANKSKNSIIMLSSLVDYKRIDRFIMLAKYFNENNYSFSFTLVLNSNENDYKKFIEMKKISPPDNINTFFKPNNIIELYQNSGFVINLTDHKKCIETFGLTLVEGMANGCIPIAPNYGGPREIISHDFGYLFNEFSCEDIFKFIKNIFDNDQFSFYSKQASLQSKKFSLDIYRKEILKSLNP